MNERTRDTGSPSGSTGRRPGWLARRPPITILATSPHIFRSLQPLVNRLSTWSHSLAARWLPGRPAWTGWRGILNLSPRPGQAFSARRDLRRLPDTRGNQSPVRGGLQMLSLPEGLRIEDPSPQDWADQPLGMAAGQPAEPAEIAPAEEAFSTGTQVIFTNSAPSGEETEPSANIQAAGATSAAPGEVRFTPPRSSASTRPAAQKISPPAWPFKLVSPFREKKLPTPQYPLGGQTEFRKAPTPAVPAGGPVGSHPAFAPGASLSSSSAQPEQGATERRLFPRPMAGEQLPITTLMRTPITTTLPEPARQTLILFEKKRQAGEAYFGEAIPAPGAFPLSGQTTLLPGSEPYPAAVKRILQRRTLHGREGETPGLAAQPAPASQAATVQSAQFSQPVPSQVRVQPPDAMLTLLSPHPAEADTTPENSSPSVHNMLAQEWPLLSILHRLETQPEQAAEPAGLQVLRRMWPEQAPLVRQTLQALASIGPGERLPAQLRETMQAQVGGDLSDVRLHTTPLVQPLRAEAFTSGRNVFFAPGRLDMTTGKGLALLGHELTHIGQPLAFKQESSAGQIFEDNQERVARQQEEKIQNIIEHGWPKAPARELQHAGRAAAVARMPDVTLTSATIQRQAEEENSGVAQAAESSGSAAGSSQSSASSGSAVGGAPSGGQSGPLAPSGPTGAPAANASVEALARQVYGILKNRLRAERDRRQLYDF